MNVLVRICLACLLGLAALMVGCSKRQGVDDNTRAKEAHGGASHDEASHGEASHGEASHGEEMANRVELSAEAREASGIEVGAVGSHTIRVALTFPGEVVPNADRLAHVVPRFAGIAREVRKGLGDEVSQDEVLAVVEGNQSLATYEVRSLISGTVIEKHITLGEFVRDDADVFVVADLSTVWVNVSVYARDVPRVRRGQSVRIEGLGGGESAVGTIDYIGSSVGEETRAASARVVLSNPTRRWKPGTFVTAHIVIETVSAVVSVRDDALQRIVGRHHVFVEDGDGFVARAVTIGRTDGEWTEIVSGLKAGERIATRGSFILKSELLKSEAGHGH